MSPLLLALLATVAVSAAGAIANVATRSAIDGTRVTAVAPDPITTTRLPA